MALTDTIGKPPPDSRHTWRPAPFPIDLPPAAHRSTRRIRPRPGRKYHVRHHQHRDNGDGGRLDVVVGLLEGDNDKRRNKIDRQFESNPTTETAHEYLAPYRSHAHCQMRSMPED